MINIRQLWCNQYFTRRNKILYSPPINQEIKNITPTYIHPNLNLSYDNKGGGCKSEI